MTAPSFALNQITFPARDYTASVAFYSALGLTHIVDSPDNGYARFESPDGTTLSIHLSDEAAGGAVIYFECEALDEWCQMLAGEGVMFDQLPRDESWGWREARLRDPCGNPLCLYWAGENRRFPQWRMGA
jgi:hydroxymethylpyrimidine/phosphomethylpyrimidine kinase